MSRGLNPTRRVLPNGLTVLAKETRTTPAVTIYAGFHAGTVYDASDCPGVAHFVSKTIDRGTVSHAADQIAEDFENRGAQLSVALNRHAMWLVCTCLSEDFEQVLALVGNVAMRPTFPDSEVETRRGEIVTLLRQDQDNPASIAMERLMRSLYGETHPYGRPMRGTLEAVERIGRADLQQFHQRRFAPQVMSLALVGDFDAERAMDVTATVFGGWPATSSEKVEFPPVVAHRARRVQVVPMMNKSQADIAYGFVSIARDDPAYYAYWLMNHIMGQYSMGGRLGDSIRERQGMAYYVFSSLDANLAPGPLTIRAGVNPANVVRAVESIDAELSGLVADGPTEQELLESKQYLIGSLPRNLETNAAIAAFLQSVEFFGLGLDYDLRVPDLLRAVTRDAVHEAARRAVDPSKATVVVAGPYDGSLS